MEESDSLSSISLTGEQIQTILEQVNNSLCQIKTESLEGLGFFCLIPSLNSSQDLDNGKLHSVLITCNSIFGIKDLKKGNNIKLSYKNKEKIIIMDESRHIYSNETFDITIIELKENEFPENIFLKLDDDTGIEEGKDWLYKGEEIYLIYHLSEKEQKYSLDQINDINNSFIKNYCPNENILLGSPILYLNSFRVFGIHQGKKGKTKYNIGSILFVPVFEYNESKENSKKRKLYNINIDDEPKCVLDLISQRFIEDKNKLLIQLNENLESAELTEVYKNEVILKFQSKITKIFDTKNDANTLLNFFSKVRGLPNLIAFIKIRDEISGFVIKQALYLNGKIDLVNNIFSLEKKDSIGYGFFETKGKDYIFQVYRPQNFHIYIKIKIDSVYVMCYREKYSIKLLIKIKQKFKDNPIGTLRGYIIKDQDNEYEYDYFYCDERLIKNKERVDELFENQEEIENYYLEELIIYKIDD